MNATGATDLASESPTRDADFNRLVARAEGMILGWWRQSAGVDLSDHRPEQLEFVDWTLNVWFREGATGTEVDYDANTMAIGCFLGEVIVRNLGGRWHFPTGLQRFLVRTFGPLSRIEKYWYVVLGKEKVLVFPAVREAIAKMGRKFSLYKFYHSYEKR